MPNDFRKPAEMTSLVLLEAEINKVILLADEGVVRMLMAVAIGVNMSIPPLWLLLVGSSAGGKTELISLLQELPFNRSISDLTTNTFASGFKSAGKETSLLMELQNGLLSFKDFTSILSKPRDQKSAIMAQLREVYDGMYDKKVGTGNNIEWKGRIFALAGATEAIYMQLSEFSAMGDRFVMYAFKQPDDWEVNQQQKKNLEDMDEKRKHLQECVNFYVKFVSGYIATHDIVSDIDTALEKELFEIAKLAALARSAVHRNYKSGEIEFIPSQEKPHRINGQLTGYVKAFLAMAQADSEEAQYRDVNLPDDIERKLLFKIAWDSVPGPRRQVLRILSQYTEGASTVGIATMLNLPTKSVANHLGEVNALKICDRTKDRNIRQGDSWSIREEYRKIILNIEGLGTIEGKLEAVVGRGGVGMSVEEAMQAREEEEISSLDVQELSWDD